MEIKGIINKIILPDDTNHTKPASKKENPRRDVFEISKEAKDLIQKTKEQHIQQIRERIKNNFYGSNEVLEYVAEKILKELKA